MGDIRLIGIFGNLGCFKTAFAVYLARVLSEQFGVPIVSNISINVPNARRMDQSELVGNDYIDTIILDDEVVMDADSRCSMSEGNIFYTYFISQARKSPKQKGGKGIGNYVIYTAQLQSMADIRLFELTNLYIMMEKLPNGNAFYESVTDDGVESSGEIPLSFFEKESFPFYDTNEKVMGLRMETLRIGLEKYIPEKINKRVDDVVEKILSEYEFRTWKDVQRFTINDCLRRWGVPDRLGLAVFDRVRERVRLQR